MKLFGIGLSRTGTTSLVAALGQLGYKAVHYPHTLEQIARYQAAADIPVSCRFQLLDQLFPGSKFIYTVRRLGRWLASCRAHYAIVKQQRQSYAALEYEFRTYGVLRFDRAAFTKAYHDHDARVRSHFKDRPNDLLVLDICAGEGWQKLCEFLDRPVPNTDFPWKNARNDSP